MKNNAEIQEEKFTMIRKWESGGLNQHHFCTQENIPFHHFYYWLKKYRKENGLTASTGKFIKLSAPIKISPENIYAEITFPTGTIIRFHQKVRTSELKQLAT